MIDLSTLGAIELRRDGIDIRSVLSQPKRLALLAYLCVAAPGTFVSRDRLVALFWPESDDERARNSLRQALHFLRRSLGESVVMSRSEQEVGIHRDHLACDAVRFREALSANRLADALELYRGELLPGFHVDDVPEFSLWLDEERSALAHAARQAAETLAEEEEARGEWTAAAVWARRLVSLDPLSESAGRRLMTLLARSGERAGALAAFDDLIHRLASVDLGPSPETLALRDDLRTESIRGPAERGERAPQPATPPPDPPGAVAGSTPTSRVSGSKGPPSGPPGPRAARVSMRSWALAAAGLLALSALVLSRTRPPRGPGVDELPAIAVLPFLDLSQGGGHEYLSHGMAEELLNALARMDGLRVAARTSSFAFAGTRATADSVGRALDVTHLLEGSIRTDGDRIRVTIQLIETEGGFHMWSETYERDLQDLFALQDEISRQVLERLPVVLTGIRRSPGPETNDPVAHELYLRGRHAWDRRTLTSIRTAIVHLEDAVERDPTYARAWAALAESYVIVPEYGSGDREGWYTRAEQAATRALDLDPSLPDPHAALGLLATYERSPDAEVHLREAIRLSPSHATAHHWYSIYLGEQGRFAEQLEEILAARALDPLSPIIQLNVGKALLHLRRFDESVAAYRQLLTMEPGFGFGHAALAEALSLAGHRDAAAASARRAMEVLGDEATPEALASAGYALARAGDRDGALRVMGVLQERIEDPGIRPGAWGPAQIYLALGETDSALQWIERAVKDGTWGGRPDLPFYDGLRSNPRFQALELAFGRHRDARPGLLPHPGTGPTEPEEAPLGPSGGADLPRPGPPEPDDGTWT